MLKKRPMDKETKKPVAPPSISKEDQERIQAGAKKFVDRYAETIIRLAKENE